MTPRTVFIVALLIGGAVFMSYRSINPRSTPLPFGTTDLSSVQKPLAKLSREERKLVEDYVKRSNGDVLPPKFADPEVPLTARTFGEAIDLQRKWVEKMKVMEARVAEARAKQQAALAPLREVVQASVVKAEILTRNEYQARTEPGFHQRAYTVDKSPTFLTTIRVENLSPFAIVAVKGSLQARDSEAYLPLDLCWIDMGASQEIPPRSSREIMCGHPHRGATPQHKAFVDGPEGRFTVEWEPKHIKFADGRTMDSGL